MTMSLALAQKFAHDWVEAWNAHDLPRVPGHYGDDTTDISTSQ
jgi:ketosteroid isomerase-like protein